MARIVCDPADRCCTPDFCFQVDAVSIDTATMQVIDQTHFSDFPLMAKLTRWGVDFHMGSLFGLLNQWLLMVFGAGLCLMIVIGYRLWRTRRPARSAVNSVQTLIQCWLALNGKGRFTLLVVAIVLGIAMPVAGCNLYDNRLAALVQYFTHHSGAVSRVMLKAC